MRDNFVLDSEADQQVLPPRGIEIFTPSTEYQNIQRNKLYWPVYAVLG
jgi:hypothetical protein